MASIFDRLVAAGAPAITEPHFYRISETHTGTVRVELRIRNTYKGSTLLGQEEIRPHGASEVVQEVVEALTELVDRHLLKEAVNELIGEHAPSPSADAPTWLEN
ncbi:hypothetical protein SEA_VROOMVROOM_52 [Arthrobacter phage VroomVroom]|uniref:Uncharacterized protein n=1 Tax=Arthrobacter phage VroomVroom TaxID=3049371 RepID=A0AA49ITJ9_9CAUD|nr:hypothetical protein SEA_VROOMVROOM_52 [Arthrobacter phage VroomVroom]